MKLFPQQVPIRPEYWPVILVFGNRALRRIFERKRDEVTGEWRKQNKEKLHDLYSTSSKIRIIKFWKMRWAGHIARMGEKRNAYRLLVGKPEGKRPLGRPKRRSVYRMVLNSTDLVG
jgi:hypothetical protein